MTAMTDVPPRTEPRWPAMLAAISAVALHFALPESLRMSHFRRCDE